MSQHTRVGLGYRHSNLDTNRTTARASNVVTRLTSRSVTGHTLPIQVHQHYCLAFHLVLTDISCIRRGCYSGGAARRICTQLERSTLEGLCSCIFDEDHVLSLSDKVEQCFRAHPVPDLGRTRCDCDSCKTIAPPARWLAKNKQAPLHCQSDICCCKGARVEMIY